MAVQTVPTVCTHTHSAAEMFYRYFFAGWVDSCRGDSGTYSGPCRFKSRTEHRLRLMSYCSVYLLSRIPVCCGNAFQHDGTRSAHVLSVTGQREIIFACDQMRCNSFSWYTNQPSNRIYSCVQFSFFLHKAAYALTPGFSHLATLPPIPTCHSYLPVQICLA